MAGTTINFEMLRQCVTEINYKKIYFPQNIPRPRGKTACFLQYFVAFLIIVYSYYNTENKTLESTLLFFGSYVSVFFYTFLLIETLKRCCLLGEERKHLASRYETSSHLFSSVFFIPSQVLIFALISIMPLMYIWTVYKNPWSILYDFGPCSLLTSAISMLLLRPILSLETGPIYDSLWIENSHGLNYGAGMASSFYHGYLKLVLPKTGTQEKNLFEQIQNYVDKEGVKFAEYKLFILIPQSTYCPVSLNNFPSIDECSSLEEKMQTVAGVQNRVYKNSVYRIKDRKGNKIYVCAEYATPLKTFNDVAKCRGQYQAVYNQQRNEIVLQFYLTLKKILEENPDSRNLCELIYYYDKDESGEYYDVGEIILNRLAYLKTRKKNE